MDNGDAHPMNIDDESDDSVEEIGKPTQSEGVAKLLGQKKGRNKYLQGRVSGLRFCGPPPEPDSCTAEPSQRPKPDPELTVMPLLYTGAWKYEYSFSIKDFMTRMMLLRCDSTGDLYPVRKPSPLPHAFLISQHTWHQRLGHPGSEVLCCLISRNFILCNKEKPLVLWHASRAASIG
ncbi:hypothetical protein Tco_0501003 [Tanacetum coccineum]